MAFGKDMFKLSDHAAAITTGTPDKYLPVAHTCKCILSHAVLHSTWQLAALCTLCMLLMPFRLLLGWSTCFACSGFFALELPRYSTIELMREKLQYAIRNCSSIDGDATHEGRANMMMTWSDSD